MSKIKNILSRLFRKVTRNQEEYEEQKWEQDEDWGVQMAKLYAEELRENTEYWDIKQETDKRRYK